MIRLAQVLADHNIHQTPGQFKQLVASIAQQIAPGWTDERITCNPLVALKICDEVRRQVNCANLAHEVILRALTNIRRVAK